jgi:hypothetical protein
MYCVSRLPSSPFGWSLSQVVGHEDSSEWKCHRTLNLLVPGTSVLPYVLRAPVVRTRGTERSLFGSI